MLDKTPSIRASLRVAASSALANAMMNLHLKVLYGENDHHKLEAMFKAFAKALDAATRRDARIDGVLSTAGNGRGRIL